MQAHPPFRVLEVSEQIPVVSAPHPLNAKWTQVSFPVSLELISETFQVMIGYGAGDQQARIKLMPWADVVSLFKKGVAATKAT
jgi:hypothetical protein